MVAEGRARKAVAAAKVAPAPKAADVAVADPVKLAVKAVAQVDRAVPAGARAAHGHQTDSHANKGVTRGRRELLSAGATATFIYSSRHSDFGRVRCLSSARFSSRISVTRFISIQDHCL